MTLTLDLPPAEEAELRRLAAAGDRPALRAALADRLDELAAGVAPAPWPPAAAEAPADADDFRARWEALGREADADLKRRGVDVSKIDISREAMYSEPRFDFGTTPPKREAEPETPNA